jgi:hypothetical protein
MELILVCSSIGESKTGRYTALDFSFDPDSAAVMVFHLGLDNAVPKGVKHQLAY